MTLSVPYSFVPGTKAKANEVNANFISVLSNIENLNSRFILEQESVSNSLTEIETQKLKKDLSNIDETGQAILDEKIDLDMLNAQPTHSFAQTLGTAQIHTVIDSYTNGTSFYRVYSDGFCIQGGVLSPWYGTNLTIDTINFLKSFKDTAYLLEVTDQTSDSNNNQNPTNLGASKYKTKFTYGFTTYRVYVTYYGERSWLAMGYVNLEEDENE